MNKIDIIELIKTIIKLRLNNASHRIVVGIIFIFSSIWAIGKFNLEKCNQQLLFLPLLLGLFLILSNLLSADKSKKNFRTKVIEIVFIFSFLTSITFLLFAYFNCSGFRQFLITSRANDLVELKDYKPKSVTKLVSKIIIKDVEKEPQNIYNTTLNYQINIYESTDSLAESPFYLAEINYSLAKTDNNLFTTLIVGAKKISLNFNENVEFRSLNEIVKNIKVFVNNLSIQKDSLSLVSNYQITQQTNFEGTLHDWTSKINKLSTFQKYNRFSDLDHVSSLRKKINLLEGEIIKLQNTTEITKIEQPLIKNEKIRSSEFEKPITITKPTVLDSCSLLKEQRQIAVYQIDEIEEKIKLFEIEIRDLTRLIKILEYRIKQVNCKEAE